MNTAFALNGFYQNRGGFIVDKFCHAINVIIGSEFDTRQHRAKPFLILGLARDRQSTIGSTVERVMKADDFIAILAQPMKVFAGNLQRSFNRLSA